MREISFDANTKMLRGYPPVKKLGAITPNGETTPFVWNGKLMRLENDDPSHTYALDAPIRAVIREWESGKVISKFGGEADFFSFYQEDDVAYVLGSKRGQRDTILIYESRDLIHWSEPRVLLQNPGWIYCNTTLVKGPDGYVLLMEAESQGVSEEIAKIVGQFYTFFFATSPDMVHWTHMDTSKCFTPHRYGGGPWMAYSEGWYYVLSMFEMPGPAYSNYFVRTKDFDTWYLGKYTPFLVASEEDRMFSPHAVDFTDEFKEEMKTGYICNNSDVDMCEFEGKTRIIYSCANQLGFYYQAEAIYDGPLAEFLERQFQ